MRAAAAKAAAGAADLDVDIDDEPPAKKAKVSKPAAVSSMAGLLGTDYNPKPIFCDTPRSFKSGVTEALNDVDSLSVKADDPLAYSLD